MNDQPESPSAETEATESSKFDPHLESMTKRDWTFLGYLIALCIIPLFLIAWAVLANLNQNPDFSNFPEKLDEYQPPLEIKREK